MKSKVAPLEGVRVLNLGGGWAGRVAAMLLADQGAEVLEIKRPDRERRLEDALLERGKAVATLDFRDPDGRERAQSLARDADIMIDNLGPGRAAGFGLDDRSIRARNPALVYVSIPGFAEGSPWRTRLPGRARSLHRWGSTPTFMHSGRCLAVLRSSRPFRWRLPMAVSTRPSRR